MPAEEPEAAPEAMQEEAPNKTPVSNGKDIPVKLDDWESRIKSLLEKPFDENKKDELKTLLGKKLVDKQGNELKEINDRNKVFGQLLITALNLDNTGFAKLFISSQYFKWDYELDYDGTTALHHVVKCGNKDIVTRIAQVYTEALNKGDIFLRTPLHYAARKGDERLVKILLNNGADIDSYDEDHQTPLHNIAWNPENIESKKQVVVARELLKHGAKVNTRDGDGDSPLHDAAKGAYYQGEKADLQLLKLLIENGADLECRNYDDKTPYDTVLDTTIPELRELFTEPPEKWKKDRSYHIPETKPQCWNTITQDESSHPDDNKSQSGTEPDLDVCWRFFAHVQFFYRVEEYSWAQSVTIHQLIHEHTKTMKDLEEKFVKKVQKKFYEGKDENKMLVDGIRSNIWKWMHIPDNQMSWVRDLVWCLTDDNTLPEEKQQSPPEIQQNSPEEQQNPSEIQQRQPKKRKEAWEFLAKNIAQRKGDKPNSFMRVPHAGDLSKGSGASNYLPHQGSKASSDKQKPIEDKNESEKIILHGQDSWRNTTTFSGDQRISIVVPYIDIESEKYLQRHEKIGEEYKIDTLRFRNMRELESKTPPYKGLLGRHLSQTLDQSFYSMLDEDELQERNRNQIVYKWSLEILRKNEERKTKTKNGGKKGEGEEQVNPSPKIKEIEDGNSETEKKKKENKREEKGKSSNTNKNAQNSSSKLLMVNQLWLWKLDKCEQLISFANNVITAFPERYYQGIEDTLLETIRQGDTKSYKRPEQLIENIFYECVTFLEEYWYAGMGVHVLDIFENYLIKRTNAESDKFKEFSQVPNSERRRISKEINTEISSIYEVKDIYDELGMLLRIFEAQKDTVEQFAAVFWPSKEAANYREAFVRDCGLDHLIERTNRLDKRAQRTTGALERLVQMKQAQGSLEEATTASRMNSYIMLFTLVTIVFTPLSFMTSLFAMPLDYLPKKSDNIVLSSKWTANRMVFGEFITFGVIVALCVIVHIVNKRNLVDKAQKWLGKRGRLGLYRPQVQWIRKNKPSAGADGELQNLKELEEKTDQRNPTKNNSGYEASWAYIGSKLPWIQKNKSSTGADEESLA